MNKSIWTDTVLPEFHCLEGDKKCDVLIIGGGLAGLLCAHRLHNMGVDYMLVEACKIACGVTKNTTAKITSQHGVIYSHIATNYGKEKAQLYLNANESAVREYESLAKNIDCDFQIKDAYTYTLKDREKIENEVRIVNDSGLEAQFVEKTELPFDIKGAIKFPNQAQFNPFKFIKGIVKELNIYENTFVENVEGNTVITNKGRIYAEKIIFATHFPFINRHGSYFLKLYQHRSYVTAFENVPTVKGMYVDEDKSGLSFRSYNNLLLIGGGSHRTGKTGDAWKEVNSFAKTHYPTGRVKYQWATQDCMSLDGLPYIGLYSKNTPDWFVTTGFNKWGMTLSMVSSVVLSDMVLGKRNEYGELFSPQRSMAKPQLIVNGLEATVNLLTPTTKRCPHMGCALKWNKHEHTWDCPCHGSRFEKDGELIDNPAKRGINP